MSKYIIPAAEVAALATVMAVVICVIYKHKNVNIKEAPYGKI